MDTALMGHKHDRHRHERHLRYQREAATAHCQEGDATRARPHAVTAVLGLNHPEAAISWCMDQLPPHTWTWDIVIDADDLDDRWTFTFDTAESAALFALTWG